MFEEKLAEKFKKIFKVAKVTYDQPAPEANEQDCIFIEIENAKNTIKDGREKSMVTGNGVIVAQSDKVPFGFFSKSIKEADPELTKDIFFFDLEVNTRRYRNLVQRAFSFVYFFDGQYDPETGSITSVVFIDEEQNT